MPKIIAIEDLNEGNVDDSVVEYGGQLMSANGPCYSDGEYLSWHETNPKDYLPRVYFDRKLNKNCLCFCADEREETVKFYFETLYELLEAIGIKIKTEVRLEVKNY